MIIVAINLWRRTQRNGESVERRIYWVFEKVIL